MPNVAEWMVRNQVFTWGKQTYLMGILNVTPDSFSDGGQFDTLDAAIAQAHYLIEAGAHILDVGGQSTRPQAEEISLATELERVVPVVRALRVNGIITPVSVDTTQAAVARAAVAAGADWVNDISGATADPEMLGAIADLDIPIVLMHMRGTPQTMQGLTDYSDLMAEIYEFLARRVEAAIALGIPLHHIMLDPGIGFAKNYPQNLEILRHLSHLRSLGFRC